MCYFHIGRGLVPNQLYKQNILTAPETVQSRHLTILKNVQPRQFRSETV